MRHFCCPLTPPVLPVRFQVRSIDNTDVLAKQKERLARVRASRDNDAVAKALLALEAAARDDARQSNLLELAVQAARVRCSLGEISEALEKARNGSKLNTCCLNCNGVGVVLLCVDELCQRHPDPSA